MFQVLSLILYLSLGKCVTCCGIITWVRNMSDCNRQREEITMDADLGLWLVCWREKKKIEFWRGKKTQGQNSSGTGHVCFLLTTQIIEISLSCACQHVGQTTLQCTRHATTLGTPSERPVRTVEGGQDCMSCGLHLKHASPEEPFMVQSEKGRRRRGRVDSFQGMDLDGWKTSGTMKLSRVSTCEDGYFCRLLYCCYSTVVPRHQMWFWLWPTPSVRSSRGTYETRSSNTLHLPVTNLIDGAE